MSEKNIKEPQIAIMKKAETTLGAICYLHSSFEAGIVHHCDQCPLKKGSCILCALKNAIKESEAEK